MLTPIAQPSPHVFLPTFPPPLFTASTALPAVFDPPLGLGAGACLAARCTHREWLACIMLGWYGGGGYWHLLGVHPPPDFEGVPISVRKVRRG